MSLSPEDQAEAERFALHLRQMSRIHANQGFARDYMKAADIIVSLLPEPVPGWVSASKIEKAVVVPVGPEKVEAPAPIFKPRGRVVVPPPPAPPPEPAPMVPGISDRLADIRSRFRRGA